MQVLSLFTFYQSIAVTLATAAIFRTDGSIRNKCTVKCTIFAIDGFTINPVEEDELEEEPEFVCEMDSAYEDGITGILYSIEGLTDTSNIQSGESTLYSEDAECIIESTPHSGGIIVVQPDSYELGMKPQRISSTTTGVRSLLIIYTIPLDHPNDQRSPEEMANDVFGICDGCTPDPANLSSQVEACSGGKMKYIPACSRETDSCYGDPDIINGVLQVPINHNIGGVSSGTVVNYNNIAANAILASKGLTLNDFNVFHVFSDQANWGGAAAWAYLPGKVSAFRDTYSYRMGVQVHEIGHNLGFHHSGYGSASYSDHSCLMGNPSYGDDGPLICFNGAKSWESTWYDDDSVTVDVIANNNYDGLLIGVDDYVNGRYTHGTHNVVLKIPDPSQSDDYYILFNRKEGANGGVTFSVDDITVTKGRARNLSWQQASLDEANSDFSIGNYGGGSRTLKVKVCSIDIVDNSVGPDVARVLVYMDNDLSCESTSSPTASPTSISTGAPTQYPTPSPTTAPTLSPTPLPTQLPTPSPTLSPTPLPTQLPTQSPTVYPTSSPSLSPTQSPTAYPTSSPSLSPTQSPISNPTQSPTAYATSSPTESPTQSPISNPTQSPTASFSHSPSVSPTESPTLPPVSTPPTAYDPWLIENTTAVIHDFDQIFVSHDINSGPRFAEVQFFEADCSTVLGEDEIISLSSGPFVYVSENITYTLNIDESQLESSDIVAFDDDARISGTISFCTIVIAKSSSNLDVSSKKTQFNLHFDMSAEFTLDIGGFGQEIEQINIDMSLSVFACECNADFECIVDVYELGNTAPDFRVCITPTTVGSSVSNLELTLANDVYEYEPVTFGVSGPAPDAITTISESESTTMISTKLVANLFNNDNSFITVSGLVALDFGGTKDSDLERIELNVLIEKPTTALHQENEGCLGFLRNLLK